MNKPEQLMDGYKFGHINLYPQNTQFIGSNLTARGSRVKGVDKVVFFGLQYFIKKYLIEDWQKNFFEKDIEDVCARYLRRLNTYLGPDHGISDEHIRELHKLGYLPIEIRALPEGSKVDLRVPMLLIHNTIDSFYWLSNAIETLLSNTIWLPCTSATTAVMYRELLEEWAEKTGGAKEFVMFQGHDFSMRGHSSLESSVTSGAAHLLSFYGTDTVPAIDFLEDYYKADAEKEMVGCSVTATEHSVACAGSEYSENGGDDFNYFKRLITEVFPKGILSLVSDTFDFWRVIDPDGGYLARLKSEIMDRDGKVVIRPDSGDPVDIVCGKEITKIDSDDLKVAESFLKDDIHEQIGEATPHGQMGLDKVTKIFQLNNGDTYKGEFKIEWNRYDKQYYFIETISVANFEKYGMSVEEKGLIQCLYEIFGGTINDKGFIELDEHIGAIYGDSITLDRANRISQRLADKGFCSTNIVYGIGSFTYQGAIEPNAIVTRDTYGFAVKATYAVVDGKGKPLFKDPVTDDGLKKSAKGLIKVDYDSGKFVMTDELSAEEYFDQLGAMDVVFKDSKLVKEQSLQEIRETLWPQ